MVCYAQFDFGPVCSLLLRPLSAFRYMRNAPQADTGQARGVSSVSFANVQQGRSFRFERATIAAASLPVVTR